MAVILIGKPGTGTRSGGCLAAGRRQRKRLSGLRPLCFSLVEHALKQVLCDHLLGFTTESGHDGLLVSVKLIIDAHNRFLQLFVPTL